MGRYYRPHLQASSGGHYAQKAGQGWIDNVVPGKADIWAHFWPCGRQKGTFDFQPQTDEALGNLECNLLLFCLMLIKVADSRLAHTWDLGGVEAWVKLGLGGEETH